MNHSDQAPIDPKRRRERAGLDKRITASAGDDPMGFDDAPAPFSRGPARRPMPRVVDPLLQWSTGLQTTRRDIYAGWLVESRQSEALDDALLAAGYDCVNIKHGRGNVVEHWTLPSVSLFVIAEGVQTISEMKHTTDRYGIAFGWRTLSDGRQQSVLRARVFLRELLDHGYHEPLLLSVKSTLTGDLIAALTRQYDVLDAVDAFREASGKPPYKPPFYACSIPLGPGAEVARGTVQTKEITPMAARISAPITREYILAHWIKREWVQLIEGLLDQTVAWSVEASRAIQASEGNGEEAL